MNQNYSQNFIEAIHQADVPFNEEIIGDGVIHRFSTGKKSRKDGWYVFYGLAGAFGDWSRDIHEKWSLKNSQAPGLDKEQIFEQIEKAKKIAEEERLQRRQELFLTALDALHKWHTFSETGKSPYLKRKKVDPLGVRFCKDYPIIPLRDVAGKLWSFQWISADGTKRFLTGGRKKGCFHYMGDLEDGQPLIITEGYATGASALYGNSKSHRHCFRCTEFGACYRRVEKDLSQKSSCYCR